MEWRVEGPNSAVRGGIRGWGRDHRHILGAAVFGLKQINWEYYVESRNPPLPHNSCDHRELRKPRDGRHLETSALRFSD